MPFNGQHFYGINANVAYIDDISDTRAAYLLEKDKRKRRRLKRKARRLKGIFNMPEITAKGKWRMGE